MKIIIENENGYIFRGDDGKLYASDKTGIHEIKSAFDYRGLKNIFPTLFSKIDD